MFLRVPAKKERGETADDEYWYMLQWLDRIYRQFGDTDLLMTRLRQNKKQAPRELYHFRRF